MQVVLGPLAESDAAMYSAATLWAIVQVNILHNLHWPAEVQQPTCSMHAADLHHLGLLMLLYMS